MVVEVCEKCGKKFGYELTGPVYPGGKDREYVYCPYCGAEVTSEMTSQLIATYKLDEVQKEE